MARSYVDRPQSEFISTKIGRSYVVKNLNATMKEDFDSADMEVLKYQRDWDKYFYGVGIIAKTGWDGVFKMPKFQVVDPRNWICDPDGDYVNGDYSYTGFEKQMYKSDLIAEGYDEDIIDDITPHTGDYR